MSDTKWTPGPWEYDDSGYLDRDGGRCIMKENLCIATAAWDMDKPRDANAHLIAAAPELYEALESVLEYGAMTGGEWVREKAFSAMRKARGENNG